MGLFWCQVSLDTLVLNQTLVTGGNSVLSSCLEQTYAEKEEFYSNKLWLNPNHIFY